MAIVQIEPFDLLTSSPTHLMSTTGFWASLSRITTFGTARLLVVTDNLRVEDVLSGFASVAVGLEELELTMRWYYLQYEQFTVATLISSLRPQHFEAEKSKANPETQSLV